METQPAFAAYGPPGPVPEIPARTAWHSAVSVGEGLALVSVIRTHSANHEAPSPTYRPSRIRWNGQELDRRSASGGGSSHTSESTEIFAVPAGPLPAEIELTVHDTDGHPHATTLTRP